MTATYNSTLPTNKDHVRFLIGDVDTTKPKLSDEEILAVIEEESATGKSLKYFAAASCLSVLMTKWASTGEGEIEREIDDLRVRRGIDQSAAQAIRDRVMDLRKKGAFYLSSKPRHFKILTIIICTLISTVCLSIPVLAQNSEPHVQDDDVYIEKVPVELVEPVEPVETEEIGQEESKYSLFSAAVWCRVKTNSKSENRDENDSVDSNNEGCDAGVGISLISNKSRSIHWVGVIGSKTVGTGAAYTITHREDPTLRFSVAVGYVSPFDSSGIYLDQSYLAIGCTLNFRLRNESGNN